MQAQACYLNANNARKNRQNLIGQNLIGLFKACYPNLTDVENPLDKNETDVWGETESISQTRGESTEASRQNIEDPPNNQDQDIVQDQDGMQEQIQEQIQPENEINIFKFYIKKGCKHWLRGNNCNYPHPAPCKKYIENPECRCGPECTNYHRDICKYSMQFKKCYNVRCYRIHLKGDNAQKIPTRTTSSTITPANKPVS